MTRLLIFFLVFLCYSPWALAQERRPSPPAITKVVGPCVRANDLLTLEGHGLRSFDDNTPALRHDQKNIRLDVLSRTETRLIVRIPETEGLPSGRNYPLVLADKESVHKYIETGLVVRLCPDAASAVSAERGEEEAVPEEVLILADSRRKTDILQDLQNRGFPVVRQNDLEALGGVLVAIKVEESRVMEVIEDLRQAFPDAEIDRNRHYRPAGVPRIYAPEKISWPEKGPCRDKARNVRIGLIDGAIDNQLADFSGNPVFSDETIISRTFLDLGVPDKEHGTAVASILVGYHGILKGSPLYAAAALRHTEEGPIATTESVSRAADWLVQNHVRLINVSLAGKRPDRILVHLFENVLKKGSLVFAAVGNDGPSSPLSYPAAIDGVIGITAIDAAGRIYTKAGQGPHVDFSAPGVDIWVADPRYGAVYKSGTSYAAPYVLAAAALVLGRNPEASRDVVVRILQENAKDLGVAGKDPVFGNGLVRASCVL